MWPLDPVTVLLFLITFIFMGIVIYKQKEHVHPNYPPGPKPWPIVGNIPILDVQKPYLSFQELAKTYGPVYSITIGVQKMVVLCGYDVVKEALVNHAEEFSARYNLPAFMDFSRGYGLAFTNGDNWKAMKRFTLSKLRSFGVGEKIMEDKINEEANYLVETFKSYKGEPFDNTMIMNTAICNFTVSLLFGHRFDSDDPRLEMFLIKIMDVARVLGCPATLEKPDPELYFHDENLTSLLLDLLSAGIETSATTMRWALLLMMKYPKIQKNVQKEIEKVIGSAKPQMAHRKHMPYTYAVIHEVQRFANVVPTNLPHMTTQDVTLNGFFLPKGTHIMPSMTSVLRDDKYFKKPDEFYPQHFLDSDGNFVKNEAFIPFSAGKRSCAGESLVKVELFLVFTKLLQNFTFTAPPGVKLDLTATVGFSSHPKKHEICAISRN
ncbi:cytochrome P450 2K1-like isoform 2-T2 [Anomaloglossus baeobatrachus]